MAKVDTLQVAVWTPERLPAEIPMVRFALPTKAHDILAQWFREKTNRGSELPVNVIVSGLSEVVAFLVPETAYIKVERDGGPSRLSLYFLAGDVTEGDIRQRIKASISLWLGLIYPKREPALRGDIADSVDDDGNWSRISVGTKMRKHDGTCAAPEDPRLFDAMTCLVARRLAGKSIRFAEGQERTMVLQTPQSALFGGVELVAFPPTRGKSGSDALWSEVITVSTATFPERKDQGIHILARPSIRNWGTVKGYDRVSDPSRALDFLMPPAGGEGDLSGYRHATFRFKATVENWKAVYDLGAERRTVAKWDSQSDHRVFDLVGRLAGSPRLADADLTHIVVGEEGRWVMPRHAPGSGDRFMSGGSGVGWPDRQDIADAIDGYLEPAGFVRAVPLERLQGRMPVKGPFNNVRADGRDEARASRRAALSRVLNAVGTARRGLDIVVFRMQDDTPQAIVREIGESLGVPDRVDGASLVWDDGLRVNVIPAVSGVLAQAMPIVRLTAEEEAGRNDRQQAEIRRSKQEEANRRIGAEMRAHVKATRAGATEIGCAILEMPSSHRGAGAADPYAVARSELSSERLLPQVMLVEDGDDGEDNPKIRAAVRDLFRMLGVLPVFEEELPYGVAAIAAIQRNAQVVGGGMIQSQAFPLAVRTRDGILECAMPQDSGEPTWMPYAEAALFIFSGVNERFKRSRVEDNTSKFHTFFGTVLEQINRSGDTVVLADMDTLGEKWMTSIQNGRLTFDRIEIGNRVFTPENLPHVRLIRLSATSNKLPTYYVEDDTQWPTGMFTWGPDARRTGYALKRKPVSAKTVGHAMPISRHLPTGDNRAVDNKPRKVSSVDEVCVALCQGGDDLAGLKLFAHRLRSVHAQYDDDTVSPFPLHELKLLGRAVTA